MKKTLLVILSLLALHSFSQKKEKSSSFEIPEGGSAALQLSNGNTFFMEITKKEGIKVLLFDSLHKKTGSGKLPLKLIGDKIGYYISEGVFEINGDVAIFIQIADGRTPVLIRILVDAKTGKLKSEEKVAELDKLKAGAGYAMAFGDVDIPDFDVVKDPESDYYAIVRYNTVAEETKDRIEILHYNPKHSVINKANYLPPKNDYKYTRYLNTYVNKDKYVLMVNYVFNTDKTGGDKAQIFLAQLSKGKSGFKQQELPYTDFYKSVTCRLEYNKPKDLLTLMLITNVKAKGNARLLEYHHHNVNPSTLKVDKEYTPDFTQVDTYYREKMENKKDFAGVLRKTGVDKNGNLILFYQEVTIETSKYGSKTYYGDVALLTISPEGKTIGSGVFALSVWGEAPDVGGISAVASENNYYVFFNNTVDNMSLPENKSPKMLKSAGPATPVKYIYANNTLKKEHLYKQPKEKKGNAYCNFDVWDYSKKTKKYTTLYIDPEKEKACLIWLNLD
jgi:hypothetical protein